MELWEVVEYTSAKVSGIVIFENSTPKDGKSSAFIHEY